MMDMTKRPIKIMLLLLFRFLFFCIITPSFIFHLIKFDCFNLSPLVCLQTVEMKKDVTYLKVLGIEMIGRAKYLIK